MVEFHNRGNPVFLWVSIDDMNESVWLDLARAVCLMFVLEGIMPFLAPGRWRSLAAVLAQVDDRSMRVMGLASMLLGVGALYFING